MKPSRISKDWNTPNNATISRGGPEEREAQLRQPIVAVVEQLSGPPPGKARVTFILSKELMERARNAVYWERLRMSAFVEEAIAEAVNRLERKRGQPFPQRREELKSGRPVK